MPSSDYRQNVSAPPDILKCATFCCHTYEKSASANVDILGPALLGGLRNCDDEEGCEAIREKGL